MRNIVVIQKGGNLNLNSRKPFRQVVKAEHKQSLLSEDVVYISVESKIPLTFNLGDKIEYAGRYFNLNTAPKVKREQGYYFYDLEFEGSQYSLRKKIYFNLDKTGFQTTADFPLTGEIDIFLKTIIENINAVDNVRWILGEFPQNTDTKTLTFNNENCLAVLQKICQEYETEFEIKEDIQNQTCTLNIKKIGNVLPYSFEYGKGNGLYSLTRDNEAKDVVTRLYVYGSTDNIPNNYRNYSDRLRMPESQGDFIENNDKIKQFGLKEGVKIFDDIKPSFKGVITSVGAFDPHYKTQEIVVQNIDFDLNEKDDKGNTKYLIDGTPVKLHFNKGNLAGYGFELLKNGGYDHATKTFKIKQFEDERGQKFPEPNTIFTFAVGDEFTLLDIVMPDIYRTNAEQKLLDKGREEYEKLSQNNVQYTLDIDSLFLKKKGNEHTIFFEIGDYIQLIDRELGIDKRSRIINITRDLLNPFEYKLDIADTFEINFTVSVLNDIKDTKKIIKTQTQVNRQNYLKGVRNIEELKENVFDTDGYFDAEKIKPNSIETNMLSVGARSQNFTLENVTLNPNVNGSPNHISITEGKLVHFSIENDVREWTVLGITQPNLLDIVYYVYAKVEKNGVFGNWHITTEKIKFDEHPTHYHFLCYLLYTPKEGKREAEAIYGNVTMHGGQITAGRIKSSNGKAYFDLDTGEFLGKVSFTDDSPAFNQVKDPRIDPLIAKTDFLNTTVVKGNTVATGNIVLGDHLGINSGITGLGDNKDVFLWGGADYSKKDKAPITIHRDGFMRVRDGNGNVIFEIGQKNSKAVFNIYNENGEIVASIGGAGIQYKNYTPEYYEEFLFVKTEVLFTEKSIFEYLKRKILIVGNFEYENGVERRYTKAYIMERTIWANLYFAGRNFEAEENKKYENIYFAQKDKLGRKIEDGIYIKKEIFNNVGLGKVQGEGVDVTITAYNILDGKIKSGKSLRLNINTRDYQTDFSEFYN